MKKVKSEMADELHPEYKRSDFGEIVRGKYVNRIKEESNVVLVNQILHKLSQTTKLSNKALRYLLDIAKL